MKKFEEEVKRPSNAGIDPFSKRDVSFEKLSSKFTKGAQTLKEWKEYAFKAEDRIRELESQLEKQQPEIPEVPQFAADWYEENKHMLEIAIFSINADICVKSSKVRCDIEDWFADAENKPIETIFAMKNGYTVAKEKRYEVVFLEDDTTRQILMENHAGYHFVEEEDENYGYWKQDFTEQEIKDIDERYWAFAVPVEDNNEI
ncbi:DUF1642 domain-containing protein [Lactococcus sp. DD01]|uniref:DUF1642 domain-containing protein n=1 Tax=Lactococcus sp. DD01 TaxID=1776443 RepID=UPI000776933F|nr:DUF1642 domain-containing protein [Lactococcus sp. DD01]KXT63207.1 Phage protein [Lactococcus sp. DD01]